MKGACWGKSRLSLSKKCLSAQCLWNWTELMKVDWQTGHWMGMLSLACFPSFLFGLYRGREAVGGAEVEEVGAHLVVPL